MLCWNTIRLNYCKNPKQRKYENYYTYIYVTRKYKLKGIAR